MAVDDETDLFSNPVELHDNKNGAKTVSVLQIIQLCWHKD